MTQPLVLSLFPGIGLLDRAFEEEGFCVVRGPDVLWGGDVHRFHPPRDRFDGVIGGPPCQPFSSLVHMVRNNGYEPRHPNLIPEFERVVSEAQPEWFVMEEAPRAPLPRVPAYELHEQMLNNRWLGEEQNRVRRISFGTRSGRRLVLEQVALEAYGYRHAICAEPRQIPVSISGRGRPKRNGGREMPGRGPLLSVDDMLEAQGFPRGMLDECPFTIGGKRTAVGNGVPLPMGRAIAKAVRRAMYPESVVVPA